MLIVELIGKDYRGFLEIRDRKRMEDWRFVFVHELLITNRENMFFKNAACEK